MKRRYYFRIKETERVECIWAVSFTEAKQLASLDWLHLWSKIEWLNP
jgi:hypothetical protein